MKKNFISIDVKWFNQHITVIALCLDHFQIENFWEFSLILTANDSNYIITYDDYWDYNFI